MGRREHAVSNGDCDQNFVGVRRIGDLHRHHLETLAESVYLFTPERHLDEGAESADFACRWHQRRTGL